MRFFIDTANIDEIKEANDLGVVCGVTTNPSLIAKEGRDFTEVVNEITTIVDGPISAEVLSMDHKQMIEEAEKLAAIHENIVIKIPMCAEGLKAVKYLSENGIRTNVTLIFSASQASYIATEIIVASVRNPLHVIEAAKMGADIATVPYKVIMQMINHPLTDRGIDAFIKDAEKASLNI